jgi:cytochrome c biogenesis protein CcdA
MLILFGAFIAGIITVFAPCVFALLPVIVGGSVTGDVKDKRRPVIIAASLAVSLFFFTLLLKVATLFVSVQPEVFTWIAGGIIVAIGLLMLLPNVYDRIILALNLEVASKRWLGEGGNHGAVIGAILTGFALGPVFSSCSPVYGYILATVLPVNFTVAIVYMLVYIAGLSLMLLLVGYLGQKLVRRVRWAANPRGWFQRIVAVLFIIVGLLIITGLDKQFQLFIADHTALDFDKFSAQLIPAGDTARQVGGVLNVVPYHAAGLEIIGVHAPEFSFEKNFDNVRQAVMDAGLTYPIAMDNDLQTWQAFNNQYWPATYLIDKDGLVRRTHFGEGEYANEEQAVRLLLAEKGGKVPGHATTTDTVAGSQKITPETYVGLERAQNYVGETALTSGEATYKPGTLSEVNQWTLGGTWQEAAEGITAVKDGVLTYRVMAKDVYLVTGSNSKGTLTVKVTGLPDKQLDVSMAQLYPIAHFDQYQSDLTVELHVPAGVQLNTFTFGS